MSSVGKLLKEAAKVIADFEREDEADRKTLTEKLEAANDINEKLLEQIAALVGKAVELKKENETLRQENHELRQKRT